MAKVEKYKQAECIECGKDISIHIYASKKKCKCDDCKEQPQEDSGNDGPVQYFESQQGPRIDGRPNKALERLCCPYHHDIPMKVIGVVKNPMWGDLVTMQCQRPGCWLVVNISEQSKQIGPMRTKSHGDGYEPDMTAEDIKEGLANGTLTEEWIDKIGKY